MKWIHICKLLTYTHRDETWPYMYVRLKGITLGQFPSVSAMSTANGPFSWKCINTCNISRRSWFELFLAFAFNLNDRFDMYGSTILINVACWPAHRHSLAETTVGLTQSLLDTLSAAGGVRLRLLSNQQRVGCWWNISTRCLFKKGIDAATFCSICDGWLSSQDWKGLSTLFLGGGVGNIRGRGSTLHLFLL